MVLAYTNSCIKHFFFVTSIHENSCHKGNIGSWNIKIYRNMMTWIAMNASVMHVYINEWMYEKFGYSFFDIFFIITELHETCTWKKEQILLNLFKKTMIKKDANTYIHEHIHIPYLYWKLSFLKPISLFPLVEIDWLFFFNEI